MLPCSSSSFYVQRVNQILPEQSNQTYIFLMKKCSLWLNNRQTPNKYTNFELVYLWLYPKAQEVMSCLIQHENRRSKELKLGGNNYIIKDISWE